MKKIYFIAVLEKCKTEKHFLYVYMCVQVFYIHLHAKHTLIPIEELAGTHKYR